MNTPGGAGPRTRSGFEWRPPAAARNRVERFDVAVDGWFDRLRGRAVADRTFEVASHLGDWGLVWNMFAVALALRSDDDMARTPRLLAAFGLESLILNQGVKRLFHRDRPLERPEIADRLRIPSTTSFPSGHASSAAFATVLLCHDRPGLAPVVVPAAVVVAASRVHTRMHFPSDVVAGAAVGYVLGRVALGIERRLVDRGTGTGR